MKRWLTEASPGRTETRYPGESLLAAPSPFSLSLSLSGSDPSRIPQNPKEREEEPREEEDSLVPRILFMLQTPKSSWGDPSQFKCLWTNSPLVDPGIGTKGRSFISPLRTPLLHQVNKKSLSSQQIFWRVEPLHSGIVTRRGCGWAGLLKVSSIGPQTQNPPVFLKIDTPISSVLTFTYAPLVMWTGTGSPPRWALLFTSRYFLSEARLVRSISLLVSRIYFHTRLLPPFSVDRDFGFF
jgi:hypothetical protein